MTATMTTVAVTGATGFLGRAFVDACLARGNVRVRALARSASRTKAFWTDPRISVHEGDLAAPATLDGFMARGDVLVHLAYLQGGAATNEAAVRALAASARDASARRVVHCSTAVVIGPRARGVVDESTTAEPAGEYQVTKLALERLWVDALGSDVELAVLRPTEVIGPGGEGLRRMIARVARGPASVNAAYRAALGARRFNYVSVRNVAAALLWLVEAPPAVNGHVFNISDDADPDNRYAAVERIVRGVLGRGPMRMPALLPLPLLSLAFRMLPGHAPPDRTYSSQKLARMGFHPVTTLRATIEEITRAELA